MQLPSQRHRPGSISGLPNDVLVVCSKETHDPVAHKRVIVNDKDSHGTARGGWLGMGM